MRKFLCVAVLLGVMGLAAAPAQAAKHHLDGTVKIATIESTGSPPISGSAQFAGSVTSSIGSGAVLGQNFFGPVVGTFHGTLQAFFTKGTVKGTLEGSGAPKPDGSIGFSGTGTITKGTGKYKGAKGNFTFEGSEPASMTVITFTIMGSVKY